MIETLDTFSYRLRLVMACLLIAACLLLLPFLLKALWIGPTAQAKGIDQASNTKSSTDESPNAITRGIFDGMDGLNKAADSMEKTVTNSINSVAKTIAATSVQTGKAVASGVSSGAKITAHAAVSSATFTGRTAGNVVGFIASTPGIDDIIRPADTNNDQFPVIYDSNSGLAQTSTADSKDIKPEEAAPADSKPQWPMHGTVTTEFGVPHWPWQPTHTGIDISDQKASGITPIHPFSPGVVKETILSRVGLGNHIIIDHGRGITSVYGHLESIKVHEGDKVNNKSVLGYEGSTGASTGTHLHFEIRLNGQSVDPSKYIAGQP